MTVHQVKSTALILALLGCMLTTPAFGDNYQLVHNPFVHPPLSAGAPTSTVTDSAGRLRPELRATLVSATDSMVNVGGKLLSIGEEVDGYRLISVSEGQAIFEKNGVQVTVLVSGNQGNDDD